MVPSKATGSSWMGTSLSMSTKVCVLSFTVICVSFVAFGQWSKAMKACLHRLIGCPSVERVFECILAVFGALRVAALPRGMFRGVFGEGVDVSGVVTEPRGTVARLEGGVLAHSHHHDGVVVEVVARLVAVDLVGEVGRFGKVHGLFLLGVLWGLWASMPLSGVRQSVQGRGSERPTLFH